MKCPECGAELKAGNWYCEKCGTEIQAVPEFEPEIESRIDETLMGVADDLMNTSRIKPVDLGEKKARSIPGKVLISVLAVAGAAAVLMIVLLFTGEKSRMTAADYVSLAEHAREDGDIEGAIEYLETAWDLDQDDYSLLFMMSRIKRDAGLDAEADEDLKKITDNEKADPDVRKSALKELIGSLQDRNETDEIVRLVRASDDPDILSEYADFAPSAPVISPAEGTYNEAVEVVLSASGNGKIFYTVGGDDPTDRSIPYTDPIVLDEEGVYRIRAVFISDAGVPGDITEAVFFLDDICPAEPVIMENSGDYDRATMIVAVAEEGSFIYYTTDGTDPTPESTRYTAPVPMPVGHSVFRFIAADLEGNSSPVVEREYNLTYSRLVTTDQAREKLMSLLAKMDVLIDGNRQRGMDGHYEYDYDGDITIEGAGEFYKFVETQVLDDGRRIASGLLYAVSTHDGSVHHLGYDSSGHYTLILMSNR